MPLEEKLKKLRKEYKVAEKNKDEDLMKVIIRRAKLLKKGQKKKSTFEIGKEVFGKR